jgi:predicted aspartyl protease
MSDDHGPWSPPTSAPPPPSPYATRQIPRLILILVIALAAAGVVYGFSRLFPQRLADDDAGYIGYYAVFLAMVSASILARGVRIAHLLGSIAIWAVIIAALLLGYSFWNDLLGLAHRLTGQV